MDIEELLSQKINIADIAGVAAWASESPQHRAILWQFVHADHRKVSVNALWVMTHMVRSESAWIASFQDELTDMLLCETDTARKRMLLQLLREQEYTPDNIRTDLLDYCLSKINSECEPYAIRAFSIYLSFKMCRHYPELLAELQHHLYMLTQHTLSPGLMTARCKTLARCLAASTSPQTD